MAAAAVGGGIFRCPMPTTGSQVRKSLCTVYVGNVGYRSMNCAGSARGLKRLSCHSPPEAVEVSQVSFSDDNIMEHEEEKQLNFWERLQRAWRVLFPSKQRSSTNAEIAKQRLKMILIADRCAVSDEAKRKIVTNIIGALSDFVEIEAEEKVQLNVTMDPDLGTVYSVTVPVRRVKPEYQEFSQDLRNVIETMDGAKTYDVRFEFPDIKS